MPTGELHVFPAARATERGLPPVEIRFRSADSLHVTDLPAGPGHEAGAVVFAEEIGPTGRRVGTIEIALFSASLIIDRAGVLHEKARGAAETALARGRLLGEGEVELDGGASGYRIDALLQVDEEGRGRPDCPYASWFALASEDSVTRGAVFAVVRSAVPDWPAASALLASLEIVGGGAPGSRLGRDAARLGLPLVRRP
jgi:hypothetical protein